MKRFIWLLLIFIVAIIVALVIHHAPGYLLLQYHHYSIAAPLWMVALFIIIVAIATHLIWQGLAWLFDLPDRFRHFRHKRRLNQQNATLSTALNAFLSRDWKTAEKQFTKLAQKRFLPTQAYLFSAEAAKAQHQHDRKREHVHQAAQTQADKTSKQLQQLYHFDNLLEEGALDAAGKVLTQLETTSIHKHHLQRRHLQLALARQDWPQAQRYLSATTERECLTIHEGTLRHASQQNLETLRQTWHKLPKAMQEDAQLICVYVDLLQTHHDDDHLQTTLRAWLNQFWSDDVLIKFAQYSTAETALHDAEKWLKSQIPTAKNQYALALLQKQHRLDERAKLSLENSIKLNPSHQAALMLLQLAMQFNDTEQQDKALKILKGSA